MGRSKKNSDVVGIDVGTGGIKVALVRDGVPIHLSQVTFGDGVVTNGELADPRLMQRILKALWDRERFPTKNVRMGLAHPASSLRPMTTPDPGNESDLRRAIELNAGGLIPGFDSTQTAFGYHVLGRQNSQLDVAIATLPTSVVREWSRVVARAGLDLVGLELSVAATGRALLDSGTVRLIIDIGSQYTTLALVEPGNSVRFLVVIDGGGGSFTESLLPLTGGDAARADQLKRACGIGSEPVGMVDISTFREAIAAMAGPRDLLVARMAEALQVMERHGAQHPTQIILTGGGARLGGMHAAVARYLTSSAAPPVLNAQLSAAPDADLYATALALSATGGASLLSPAAEKKPKRGKTSSGMGRKRVRVGDVKPEKVKAERSVKGGDKGAVSPPIIALAGLAAGVLMVWGAAHFYLEPSAQTTGEQALALEKKPTIARASVNAAVQQRIIEATRILRGRSDISGLLDQWGRAEANGVSVTRMYRDIAGKRFVVDIQAPTAAGAADAATQIETAIKGATALPPVGKTVRIEIPDSTRFGVSNG